MVIKKSHPYEHKFRISCLPVENVREYVLSSKSKERSVARSIERVAVKVDSVSTSTCIGLWGI